VPWRRLGREWLIYAGIMVVVFAVFFRDDGLVPILIGLLVSGPLYLALAYVLAKLGYQRKTLAELRTPRAGADAAADGAGSGPPSRPSPTRRTSTGPNRPARSKRR
jgi:hypothetical protein